MTKAELKKKFSRNLEAALAEFPQSDIMLLFSGGMDSSTVGILAALTFPDKKINLLTCNNGSYYPEELRRKTTGHALEIKKLTGHKEIHLYYLDVRIPFISFGIRFLQEDAARFKIPHLCLACKLCMQSAAALWGSQNNSFIALNGYNKTQSNTPEQVREVQLLVGQALRKKTGVRWESPLYNLSLTAQLQDEQLAILGSKPELHDREKGGQAICALGGNFKALFGFSEASAEFREYKKNTLAYAKERLPVLLSDKKRIEKRERGIKKKPSFWQQLKQAALEVEKIV
jgi:hypothetical protein